MRIALPSRADHPSISHRFFFLLGVGVWWMFEKSSDDDPYIHASVCLMHLPIRLYVSAFSSRQCVTCVLVVGPMRQYRSGLLDLSFLLTHSLPLRLSFPTWLPIITRENTLKSCRAQEKRVGEALYCVYWLFWRADTCSA